MVEIGPHCAQMRRRLLDGGWAGTRIKILAPGNGARKDVLKLADAQKLSSFNSRVGWVAKSFTAR